MRPADSPARLASLAVPALAVVCLGLALRFGSFESASDARQRESLNAGHVLNGGAAQGDSVAQMDAALASNPEVLILGNSHANTDIQPRRLAVAIGLEPEQVVVLSVPNSIASHWYAILENRVYAHGHTPKLVVIVSGLQSLLLSEPYSEASYTNLMVQLAPEEPVLDRFVHREPAWVTAVRQNRINLRDTLLDRVRASASYLVYPGPTAAADTQSAVDRVFHDSHLDADRLGQRLAFLDDDEPASLPETALPDPEDSLVRELSLLAAEHGTRLVFVRTPLASRTPDARQDAVGADVPERVADLLAITGNEYVDTYDLKLPPTMFRNLKHMTPEGAALFTERIAPDVRSAYRSP